MTSSLCIQIFSPFPGQQVAAGSELVLQALVTLACGCPPGAGGRFDFRRFQLKGLLARPDGSNTDLALAPGSAGMFAGRVQVGSVGVWQITVEAYDPESGMAGRARVEFKAG
jgi:hypothetical protein